MRSGSFQNAQQIDKNTAWNAPGGVLEASRLWEREKYTPTFDFPVFCRKVILSGRILGSWWSLKAPKIALLNIMSEKNKKKDVCELFQKEHEDLIYF